MYDQNTFRDAQKQQSFATEKALSLNEYVSRYQYFYMTNTQ